QRPLSPSVGGQEPVRLLASSRMSLSFRLTIYRQPALGRWTNNPRPHVPGRSWGGSSHDMSLTRVAPAGPAPSLRHGRRAVREDSAVCVGLDTHKAKIAVAVAEPGRSGEVRFRGEIANRPEAVRRLLE